jgi:hypothetical protein
MTDLKDSALNKKLLHEILRRRPEGLKRVDIDCIFDTVELIREDKRWMDVWFRNGKLVVNEVKVSPDALLTRTDFGFDEAVVFVVAWLKRGAV